MEYFLEASDAAFRLIFSLDREVYAIVWTSLYISLTAALFAAIVSVPAGIFIALNDFPGKALLLQILNTLMALPTVVVGLLLYGLLTRQGPAGELGMLYTPAAMIIGQFILITPIMCNLSVSTVSSADARLLMTCRSLGAGTWQQVLVFISELRLGLMAAVITGFGRAIGEVGVAMMLGGNIEGFTRTMTTAIALETSKGEFELALALGILLLAVAFIVNGLLFQLQRKSA
ncbi:MAG: ABC transporter permease [Gammaproteobacteria bacterium]|nr:ABC transporter permease [Gammaproteobacteria bacterium]